MLDADESLTILLTLKGRTPFTVRWMSYADTIAFPFRVLVADGSADTGNQDVLSDPGRFPRVRYEYVRYPIDRTYRDFYAKVEDALSRIRTPFVAIADNDDFFVVSGLRAAVDFLSTHEEYATCGGQRAYFWIGSSRHRAPASPDGGRIEWKCESDAGAVDDANARDRVRAQGTRATYEVYHHVRRTDAIKAHFHTLRALDLSDLFLHAQLLAFLSAIAGKTRQLDAPYMAKQLNSPDSSAATHIAASGDWLGRMLMPSWSDDFTKLVAATSAALAARDHIPLCEARRWIIDSYRAEVAPPILVDVLTACPLSMPRLLGLWGVRRLLALPPDSPLRRLARAIYRRATWIAVDVVRGTQAMAGRIPGASRDRAPVHQFLMRESPVATHPPCHER